MSDKYNNQLDSLGSDLIREQIEILEQLLSQTFERKHQLLVLQLRAHLQRDLARFLSLKPAVDEGEWVAIESLSRLRQVVGGRFDNIKRKWCAAGFPLKDHRGSEVEQYEIDAEGWLDLSNWMIGQGFESRMQTNKRECFFEVRASKRLD